MANTPMNIPGEPLASSKTLANNNGSQNRKLTGDESYTELDGDSGIRAHPRSGPARPHRKVLLVYGETHELEGAPNNNKKKKKERERCLCRPREDTT